MDDRKVIAPEGRSASLAEVALNSLHQNNQHQFMTTAYQMSYQSPIPIAAQFARVVVDAKTGAEISIDGIAPVLINAIHDATGVWVRELHATPERVLWAILQAM